MNSGDYGKLYSIYNSSFLHHSIGDYQFNSDNLNYLENRNILFASGGSKNQNLFIYSKDNNYVFNSSLSEKSGNKSTYFLNGNIVSRYQKTKNELIRYTNTDIDFDVEKRASLSLLMISMSSTFYFASIEGINYEPLSGEEDNARMQNIFYLLHHPFNEAEYSYPMRVKENKIYRDNNKTVLRFKIENYCQDITAMNNKNISRATAYFYVEYLKNIPYRSYTYLLSKDSSINKTFTNCQFLSFNFKSPKTPYEAMTQEIELGKEFDDFAFEDPFDDRKNVVEDYPLSKSASLESIGNDVKSVELYKNLNLTLFVKTVDEKTYIETYVTNTNPFCDEGISYGRNYSIRIPEVAIYDRPILGIKNNNDSFSFYQEADKNLYIVNENNIDVSNIVLTNIYLGQDDTIYHISVDNVKYVDSISDGLINSSIVDIGNNKGINIDISKEKILDYLGFDETINIDNVKSSYVDFSFEKIEIKTEKNNIYINSSLPKLYANGHNSFILESIGSDTKISSVNLLDAKITIGMSTANGLILESRCFLSNFSLYC